MKRHIFFSKKESEKTPEDGNKDNRGTSAESSDFNPHFEYETVNKWDPVCLNCMYYEYHDMPELSCSRTGFKRSSFCQKSGTLVYRDSWCIHFKRDALF